MAAPAFFIFLLLVLSVDGPSSNAVNSTDQLLSELYSKKQLLNRKNYPKLRRIYAESFEKEHGDTIRAAWGDSESDSESEFRQWLEKNFIIKEEFYLAVEPEKDDLSAALKLFKELWQKYPKKVEEYPALTIATAVVWDQKSNMPRDSRWQYGAVEPENPMDAFSNFAYYSSMEKYFGNRVKLLPYEFLTYVVCHNTTLEERKWAVENYYSKREKLGKAYHEIKWLKDSKIKGNPYTLPNQKLYGGVCTCRADFAVQLCRSLAVPAFTGGSGHVKYGGGHAWVVWVEITNLSLERIDFTVEHSGRYKSSSHIYHTGETRNPRYSTKEMNDRKMRSLFNRIGQDVMAYRQAKVVMKLYPQLLENEKLPLAKQLEILNQIDDFSPRFEEAWSAMAAAVANQELDKKERDMVLKLLAKLIDSFAKHPDFTLEVLPDLLSSPSMLRQRDKVYDRLFVMLETAKRTDLIFKARRLNARRLVEEDRAAQAIVQLGQSTIRYAVEANRIEPMLDEIENTAGDDKKHQSGVAKFYQQFLNKIVELESKVPKKYSRDMFERGGNYFDRVGDAERAKMARTLAAKVIGEDSTEFQPPQ